MDENNQIVESQWVPEEEFMQRPKKYTRHIFSLVGISYAIIFLGTVVLQLVMVYIIARFAPQLQKADWYVVLLSAAPLYLVTMPICVIIMNEIDVCPIEKHNMSFGRWLSTFLMCVPIMYIGNIIGTLLMNFMNLATGKVMDNPLNTLLDGNNIYLIFVYAVIMAPIVEEYIFRKLLIDRIHQYGEGIAIIVSGMLFGLFHGNFYQFFYAFAVGTIFAYIYIRTGKIIYSIAMHMVINFMGSGVGVFILKNIDLDRISNLDKITNQQQMMQEMQVLLPQIILVGIYGLIILSLFIAGIVCLILNRNKFKLTAAQCQIPKGLGFSVVMGNLGMIVALVCGIGIYILNFAAS